MFGCVWAASSRSLRKRRASADDEDRVLDYKDGHRTLGPTVLMCDLDSVEFRMAGGLVEPKALIELTRVDGAPDLPMDYLEDCLDRILWRDVQGAVAAGVAKAIDVDEWFVVFLHDLSEFYLFNLSSKRGWWKVGKPAYGTWLKLGCLHPKGEPNMLREERS